MQNDSTVNVNPKENERVHETITYDSTASFFEKMQREKSDSLHRMNELDSLDKQKQIPITGKELPQKKVKPQKEDFIHPRDSLEKTQDSLQIRKHLGSLRINDTLKNNKSDTAIVDSSQKQIELQRDSTKPDSIKNKISPLEDRIGKENKVKLDTSNISDTTIRYFLAFHHVKVFNDSLQSICDSLFISSKDSVFRLYYDPVVWSGNTQISGDTMFLYTENKQPKRLYVFEKGLIVSRTKEGFFNQISGKTINGYFMDGKIDYMRVKGSQSESIYYIQNDDSAYIGMNRATGDVIDLYFKNEQLKKVLFVNSIQGKMYPMNQIPEEERRLRTFKWLEDRRPKNKAELFE